MEGELVDFGQRQVAQVLNEPAHAQRLIFHGQEDLLIRRDDIVDHAFQIALQDGQGRPQFMGDVGKQAAPHLIVFRQFLGHIVESLRQGPDFVMTLDGYGLAIRAGFDLLDGVSQGRQRPHDFPDNEVADGDADGQHDQADPQQRPVDSRYIRNFRRPMHHAVHHPHALMAVSHHLRHVIQILGKMAVHLIIDQDEQDGDSQENQDKDHPGQADDDAVSFLHDSLRRIYNRSRIRSGYTSDGPGRAPVSCADCGYACR